MWVDDDYTPGGFNDGHFWCYDAFDKIQDGVDAVANGGVVHVAAGTYQEQVVVNKSLGLLGTGSPVVTPPPGVLSSYTIQESGARFEPLIFAYGGTDNGSHYISGVDTIAVTISGFAVDGNNRATVNRFVGIMLRNCRSSAVSYNNIYRMLYSSGLPETFGIIAYGNSQVRIDHNTVDDWTRGGIGANGDNGPLADPMVVIANNMVIGEGPLPLGNWAQNGIQIGYGATGSVHANEVHDVAYTGPNWSASGILLIYPSPDVILKGNYVHDCQGALNAYYVDGLVIDSNNVFSQNDFQFLLGCTNTTVQGNTFFACGYGLYLGDVTDATISGNNFSNNDYAVVADGACAGLRFIGNSFTGSTSAAAAVVPYGGYEPIDVVFHSNNISGNAFGIDNSTANMVDAEANWWGDASGPTTGGRLLLTGGPARPPLSELGDDGLHQLTARSAGHEAVRESATGETPSAPSASAGTGDAVSALVDYSPWWGQNYVGHSHATPWQWYVNTSNSSTIQEGIDWATDGDAIYLTADTFSAPVNIDARNDLRLIGLDRTTSVFRPTSTLSWSIPGYPQYNSRQAAIRVVNSINIGLVNMTVDLDLVKGNNVIGVLYWNSSGQLRDNELKNNCVPDAAGGYYEVTSYIRAPQYSDNLRAELLVKGNKFTRTGRLAIVTHDYVHTVIDSNLFDQQTDDFGYGIEMGSLSTGTISRNIFRNFDTFAASDSSSVAAIYVENAFTSGLGPLTKNVTIIQNDISNCQFGLWIGNEYPGFAGDVDIVASVFGNAIHDNTGGQPLPSGGAYVVDEGKASGSSVRVNFVSNTFGNNGDFGVYFNTFGNGDITATFSGDTITGHDIGLAVEDHATGPSSSRYDIVASTTSVMGNTSYGIYNGTTWLVEAEDVWWGHNTGPFHPIPPAPCPLTGLSNPEGLGDQVTNYVDYAPWSYGLCTYVPGDINGDGNVLGSDVTYGVRYLKGLGPQPPDSCWNDSSSSWLYVAGDVNGDCRFVGSDITRLVAFFKGLVVPLSWCPQTPPYRPLLLSRPSQSGEHAIVLPRLKGVPSGLYR